MDSHILFGFCERMNACSWLSLDVQAPVTCVYVQGLCVCVHADCSCCWHDSAVAGKELRGQSCESSPRLGELTVLSKLIEAGPKKITLTLFLSPTLSSTLFQSVFHTNTHTEMQTRAKHIHAQTDIHLDWAKRLFALMSKENPLFLQQTKEKQRPWSLLSWPRSLSHSKLVGLKPKGLTRAWLYPWDERVWSNQPSPGPQANELKSLFPVKSTHTLFNCSIEAASAGGWDLRS